LIHRNNNKLGHIGVSLIIMIHLINIKVIKDHLKIEKGELYSQSEKITTNIDKIKEKYSLI